jgi:hypothetical protein
MVNDELTYINEDGYTVFKSQFHRNRGRCCQSACLHCPYGTTLRKHGLSLHKDKPEQAKTLFDDLYKVDDFTSSLMGNAFGKPKSVTFNESTFFPISLKDVFCGLVEVIDGKLKSFKLLSEFSDQGITEEYLKSIL